AQSFGRHADGHAGDQAFGERSIGDALGTKALLQARGRAEHAAVDADVLADDDHAVVVFHRARQREIDAFNQRDVRHRAPSPRRARQPARRTRAAVARRDARTSARAPAAAYRDTPAPSSAHAPARPWRAPAPRPATRRLWRAARCAAAGSAPASTAL